MNKKTKTFNKNVCILYVLHVIYVLSVLGVLGVSCILTGCKKISFRSLLTESDEKEEPSLYLLKSELSFAVKEDYIAYVRGGAGYDLDNLCFLNQKSLDETVLKLPENRKFAEITSGEKYFYVFCEKDNGTSRNHYVRVYDKNKFLYEVSVPFSRVLAKNGYIFGYETEDGHEFSVGTDRSNSCIEAHYYIPEKDFSKEKAGNLSSWTKMEGADELMVGDTKMYRCKKDSFHGKEYYSDAKDTNRLYELNYLLVCDGVFSSGEEDEESNRWIREFHEAMGSKEENFEAFFGVKEDKYYGICNVYKKSVNRLRFQSKDIKYSFLFEVEEDSKHIKKISEHEKVELIYEDEDNLVYKNKEKVYYQNKRKNEGKLVYTYPGGMKITFLNGSFRFTEIEANLDREELSGKDQIIKLF